MHRTVIAVAFVVAMDFAVGLAAQQPNYARDFQGMWTNGTLTPLQRPPEFADKPTLGEEEGTAFEKGGLERLLKLLPHDDVVTAGDLNDAYLETSSLKLVEGRRTSLIVDPPNGRLPALVPEAQKRLAARPKRSFDNVETLTLDERCIFSTAMGSSNAAPPMVPNTFGLNFYQIVQTKDHVMILSEMVHDARVIRMGGRHVPSNVRLWLGDSIGRWEADTLVVDSTNFSPKSAFRGATEHLHVVERFTRTGAATIRYVVTVEDPETWAAPWTADIPFTATSERMFEYSCHEANYSLAFGLRNSRLDDK